MSKVVVQKKTAAPVTQAAPAAVVAPAATAQPTPATSAPRTVGETEKVWVNGRFVSVQEFMNALPPARRVKQHGKREEAIKVALQAIAATPMPIEGYSRETIESALVEASNQFKMSRAVRMKHLLNQGYIGRALVPGLRYRFLILAKGVEFGGIGQQEQASSTEAASAPEVQLQ